MPPATARRAWRAGSHIVGLTPLGLGLAIALLEGLGVNPVESLTLWSGRAAIVLLILSLACTPANTVFGLRQAVAVRRTLGLYAFAYAALHFLVFLGIDYGFDLALVQADALAEKPFLIVGTLSGLLLLLLATTSSDAAKRRLGRNWKRLHRLAYVAAGLAAVHFVWKVKALTAGPTTVVVVVALLLALRLPPLRRSFARARSAWSRRAVPRAGPS